MSGVSPARLERAMSGAMQALQSMPTEAALQHIGQETELWSLVDRLGEQVVADSALAEAAAERADRLEKRADNLRSVLAKIMEALELKTLERPLFLLSVAKGRESVVVSDPGELPDYFIRSVPDKIAIGKALRNGEVVEGATLSNGPPVLRILISRAKDTPGVEPQTELGGGK